MYADDTQLYLAIEPSNISDLVFSIESCIREIKNWMLVNRLKLNDEKTEIMLLNPKKYQIHINSLSIGEETITFSKFAKNLGVYFNDNLTMDCHITNLCKSVYLEIRRLRHMSNFVNETSLKILASSFILSKIDYSNSLFKNINKDQINKLQKLQNFAAKSILKKSRYDHATPCLIELHWLPVEHRINYKIAVLAFKCLHGLAPGYLADLIQRYEPARSLRSSSGSYLTTKVAKFKTLGDRSFSVTAPLVWNNLPINIRQTSNLNKFKRLLKTYYFNLS